MKNSVIIYSPSVVPNLYEVFDLNTKEDILKKVCNQAVLGTIDFQLEKYKYYNLRTAHILQNIFLCVSEQTHWSLLHCFGSRTKSTVLKYWDDFARSISQYNLKGSIRTDSAY